MRPILLALSALLLASASIAQVPTPVTRSGTASAGWWFGRACEFAPHGIAPILRMTAPSTRYPVSFHITPTEWWDPGNGWSDGTWIEASVLVLGNSRTTWGGQPLPFPLQAIGLSRLSNCFLRVSTDVVLPMDGNSSLRLPGGIFTAGTEYYAQAVLLRAYDYYGDGKTSLDFVTTQGIKFIPGN